MQVIHGKVINIEEAEQMSNDRHDFVLELLRSDPVTSARYIENRFRELFRFMRSQGGPFSQNRMLDWFWRIEFNERGSPHLHSLTWHEGVPIYRQLNTITAPTLSADQIALVNDNQNRSDCISFVDAYITCH